MPNPVAGMVGSAVGGVMQGNAAGKAADAQLQASREATALQREMWETGRTDMEPWRRTGQNALALYAAELGMGGGRGVPGLPGSAGATRMPSVKTITGDAPNRGIYETTNGFFNVIGSNGTFKTREDAEARIAAMAPKSYEVGGKSFANMSEAQAYAKSQARSYAGTSGTGGQPYQSRYELTPDFQFQLSEGQKAIERQMAANGLSGSGAMGRSLVGFSQGVAQQGRGEWMNRLASLSGLGQTTATAGAGFAQAFGNSAGNNIMAGGQARASGYLGQGQAWGNALENMAYFGGQMAGAR